MPAKKGLTMSDKCRFRETLWKWQKGAGETRPNQVFYSCAAPKLCPFLKSTAFAISSIARFVMKCSMFNFCRLFLGLLARCFRSRRRLLLENLALRQQLAVLKRSQTRPTLLPFDRFFWMLGCVLV